MPLSPEEIKKRHLAMFGVEDMEKYYAENFMHLSVTGGPNLDAINAAGLLSDCQDILAGSSKSHVEEFRAQEAEKIRQLLNMAKWILSHKLSGLPK